MRIARTLACAGLALAFAGPAGALDATRPDAWQRSLGWARGDLASPSVALRDARREVASERLSAFERASIQRTLGTFGLADADSLPEAASADPESLRGRSVHFARRWGGLIVMAGVLGALQFAVDPPEQARWSGGNGFDDPIQTALGASSAAGRARASDISDYAMYSTIILGIGDWFALREEYPLMESVRVDAHALVANSLVNRAAKVAAGRARPHVVPCLSDPRYVEQCNDPTDDNASFYSGHASTAATFAGLLCARRLHRAAVRLGDRLLCGVSTSGALLSGLLRITSERHYMTDTLTGWASGLIFGYVLPSRLVYARAKGEEPSTLLLALSHLRPLANPRFTGLQLSFRF